jgi:hypothetical protein
MNIRLLYDILHLADSIFIGLKIFVPLIFLLWLFKFSFRKLNFEVLVLSLNLLLLVAGILFLLTIGINTCLAWFSGNEFERQIIISIATGPTWFQFMLPIFVYGILTQAMWIAKFRQTVFSSVIIVIAWFSSYFITAWLSLVKIRFDFLTAEYGVKAGVFTALLAVFYFFISRRFRKKNIA